MFNVSMVLAGRVIWLFDNFKTAVALPCPVTSSCCMWSRRSNDTSTSLLPSSSCHSGDSVRKNTYCYVTEYDDYGGMVPRSSSKASSMMHLLNLRGHYLPSRPRHRSPAYITRLDRIRVSSPRRQTDVVCRCSQHSTILF